MGESMGCNKQVISIPAQSGGLVVLSHWSRSVEIRRLIGLNLNSSDLIPDLEWTTLTATKHNNST